MWKYAHMDWQGDKNNSFLVKAKTGEPICMLMQSEKVGTDEMIANRELIIHAPQLKMKLHKVEEELFQLSKHFNNPINKKQYEIKRRLDNLIDLLGEERTDLVQDAVENFYK